MVLSSRKRSRLELWQECRMPGRASHAHALPALHLGDHSSELWTAGESKAVTSLQSGKKCLGLSPGLSPPPLKGKHQDLPRVRYSRIGLAMEGTWMRFLIRELRSTCLRATKTMRYHWASELGSPCATTRVVCHKAGTPHDATKIPHAAVNA